MSMVADVELIEISKPEGSVLLPGKAAACALEAWVHPNGYAASWDTKATATRISENVICVSIAKKEGGDDIYYVRPPATVLFELTERD